MGKKKSSTDKVAKAHRQEVKKAKQSAKGAKKDRKALGTDEGDIELILQEFRKKDAERTQVIIEAVQQPTPRANFTLSALPSGDMLLFGGEYFDGDVNECYNDVFKWNLDAKQLDITDGIALNDETEMVRETAWKSISSPNTPPPRCSHQSAVYREHLYVFGGEFATADQFHHYRDLWRLNLKTNAWEELEVKGGPSPRSGHRMVVWRNFLVVFGGFYEAARETKWFNDLYLFNLVELKWQKIVYAPHRQVPAERSGCQLAVHPSKDLIFLYGGYAKVKNAGEKAEGKVYSDLWALNLTPTLKRQSPTWEKLSRKGQAPSPRSGAAVTVHKQRFILFGGVFDEEKRRHTIESTFYNDLFVYDMDRRRWFEFNLRGKKTDGKRRRKKKDKMLEGHESDSEKEEVKDFDAMLEKQFGYVDDEGNIVYIEDAHEETKEDEEKDECQHFDQSFVSEAEEKKEEEEEFIVGEESKMVDELNIPAPCPRINPALMIRGSTLYVYGGVVEDGDREITLDDCWSLDLKRLDEWKKVLPGTMSLQIWKGEVSETEESSDDDDDDEDEVSEDEENEENEEFCEEKEKTKAVERAMAILNKDEDDDGKLKKRSKSKQVKTKESHRKSLRAEMEKLQEQLGLDDIARTPQMGENLRDFFARTNVTWATEVMKRPSTVEHELNAKEIKREGFLLAETRYKELLPEMESFSVFN
ncbi:Protein containing repeated kelch motifs [Plasmopara halstedii]|uniref:Protein containing repeated kelch motifs n=1 Tax=Plasmopara halstedii TaxID=4781 RepID=A0A0P1B425_PLAHL|nr:Protein containing repeated kelch motifs [Plasmopara halstedii]CEG48418.1 Protein containing repeated kelch motifs [Plasmopara halstedii]|eukprot:XP_024584787.1 Protein containing repeated kelch motifs [Plasmopara halstedii]